MPPAELPEAVRRVFSALVSAVDAKHFSRVDAPLLIEYCSFQ